MKYVSLLSLTIITSSLLCMQREKVTLVAIDVRNQTPWTIEAQIKGFGVKDINSDLEDWNFHTGEVNIMPEHNHRFTIPTYSTQFPMSSTIYRPYAHALIVKYLNNKNSEVNFSNPLNAQSNYFVVKNDETTNEFRLIIENIKK